MLDLKYYPDEILRKKCASVKQMDSEFRQNVKDMVYILNKTQGLGLSAPQVGLSQSFFIWIFEPSVIVNPYIEKRKGRPLSVPEGCLSIPGKIIEVPRSMEIEVSFYDIKGKEHNVKLKDAKARVFQHEYDHLLGRLILDYE